MNILIIGGGKMGMSHLAILTQYLGKNSVSLCDTKIVTRILFRLLGYKTFSSVNLAANNIEQFNGVLIATPTFSHAPLVRWAIEKKLPCFVEKPLSLDVKTSKELTALADAARVHVQVGFVMRYLASFQRLRQLVKNKEFGQLHGYKASMRGNVITKPPSQDDWQGDFSRGGGCLNEYGPHIIDLSRFIFGSISDVGVVEIDRVYSSHADDRISVDWTHENSIQGHLEIDWCDTTKRKSVIEFRVFFEHANLRADNSTIEIEWNDSSPLSPETRAMIAEPLHTQNVAYYLRGEEFSLELEDFLSKCYGYNLSVDEVYLDENTAYLKDGYEVDRLIDEIARRANLK